MAQADLQEIRTRHMTFETHSIRLSTHSIRLCIPISQNELPHKNSTCQKTYQHSYGSAGIDIKYLTSVHILAENRDAFMKACVILNMAQESGFITKYKL
jgi:hypothetical protein